ncbi:MAG: SDR family oxidoreductase [Anaerolineae bacterium]|jgi:NAD(P)-dependent dehydrogenase (short-subunit alcohol dehydrogenase family)|nr:SDR family oxidoreductase [Anaerolineae bacterium]
MHPLNGHSAIVTGAAQGLGYAIAMAYARAGLRQVLLDVQAQRLHQVAAAVRALGAECLPLVVDLSDAAATGAAVAQGLAQYGPPRVLVHNAALLRERSLLEIDLAGWQMEVNIILQAAFILSQAVWQPMIDAGGGSIVYLSSGSGIKGFLKEVAYCPAKHGQEGLMKVLALEGEPFNIAVNSITPGAPINTPMSASNYPPELKERWIDPERLTPAFVHLAQLSAADGITGQRLNAWELSQQLTGAGPG